MKKPPIDDVQLKVLEMDLDLCLRDARTWASALQEALQVVRARVVTLEKLVEELHPETHTPELCKVCKTLGRTRK